MAGPVIAELPPEVVEAVARSIHERYRAHQAGRKPADDPALAEWRDLPEQLRRSNRAQAADIPAKLLEIGCTVQEASVRGEPERIALSPEEIELMAVLEHDRWTADRLADEWTPGERDVLAWRTPYLVDRKELPDEVTEWDREAVRAIPELLAGVGLEISRR